MKKNIRKIKQELRNFSLSDFAMRRRRLNREHRNFSEDREFFDAIYDGDIETISRLIDSGEDLNVIRGGGWTPLSLAATKRDPEVVQFLIDKGADVNLKNNWGETALDSVMTYIYRSTIERGIHAEDYIPNLKCLLQNGAKIYTNYPDPFCVIVSLGDVELVQLMLSAGADPNEKDSSEWSPLLCTSSPEIAKVLLDAGADPDTQNAIGRSALRAAAANGMDELVKVLLDAGADIDIAGDDGDTPLIRAIQHEQTPTALLLIDAGADVNSVGERVTPLIVAGITGLLEVTKALIAAGANKGIEEALECAEEQGHSKVASYLRQVIAEQGTRGSRRPRRRR